MKFLFSWLKEFIELSLPPETLGQRLTIAGLEVTNLTRVDGDWLFEVEITPNRPDLLSHLGIARETAAVLGKTFRFPRWLRRELQPLSVGGCPVKVSVEDPKDCARYIGVVIEGVKVGPSSNDIADRLARLGLRTVNNVVDATNLCLLEMGQPLHGFDLDRLQGETLVVRRAKTGETLVTLDGEKHPLSPELLVIADVKKPAALAGIMGGRDSEISNSTRRVFLESAFFDPLLIRRGIRRTKLSSDSSYRFERGVDPEGGAPAAIRAARLIVRLAGGRICGWTDTGFQRPVFSRRLIPVKPAHVQKILGAAVTLPQQRRILEQLGCAVRISGRSWRVNPPSWRADLRIPEDLHEEIARVWGYDRIAPTSPPFPRTSLTGGSGNSARNISFEFQVRDLLAAEGFQEILSYSLVSPADRGRIGLEDGEALTLENPLSLDYSVLRDSLLVGSLQTVARNFNRKSTSSLRLFEIGYRYGIGIGAGKQKEPAQTLALSLTVAGLPIPSWGRSPRPLGALNIKGAATVLFERLGIVLEERIEDAAAPGYLLKPSLVWEKGGRKIGFAGDLEPRVAAAYDLPEDCPLAYAEFEIEELISLSRPRKIQPLPKVPPILRDLAIVVAAEIPHHEIAQTIQVAGHPLLRETSLFDLYQGKQIPAGKKSLAFHLWFSAPDRTLTDSEIADAHKKILNQLKSKFQGSLR